jgi:hypothetical protein
VSLGIELPAARPWREAELEQRTNHLVWEQIAESHETETSFDTHVRELMLRKFPTAQAAAPLAISKSAVEFPLLRNLKNSEGAPSAKSAGTAPFPSAQVAAPIAVAKRSVEVALIRSFDHQPRIASLRGRVSLDTVQNNYMRRTVILAFIAGPATQRRLSLTAINNWVYGQVFLTPAEDPWLGLAPPDADFRFIPFTDAWYFGAAMQAFVGKKDAAVRLLWAASEHGLCVFPSVDRDP